MNAKILGLSVGIALSSGAMAAAIGVPATIGLMLWSAMILGVFFPEATRWAMNRFGVFLAD